MRVFGGEIFDLENGFVTRDLCTNGDRIAQCSDDASTLNATGCYVIPGLVDVHFHACVGEDFSDGTPEGLQKIADFELHEGVTHICPAGMTLSEEQLSKACRNAALHKKNNKGGAELVGVHLEGPFLSTAKKGAQNEDFLHVPDLAMLRRLNEASEGLVRLVTVAPEEPNGLEFIKGAVADGIRVSIGHTVADYETTKAAFAAGADHITHLYNGMPSLHHRKPSVIVAAAENDNVFAELICDGVHIHEAVIRYTFRQFGAERMIIISDSLRAAGMGDGEYPCGGQMIEVHGNRATIFGHPETLAGSVTSLMGCLKYAVSIGIPLTDAVRASSYNPAKSIGLDAELGTLDEGKCASFVLLDKTNLEIRAIVHKGILVR